MGGPRLLSVRSAQARERCVPSGVRARNVRWRRRRWEALSEVAVTAAGNSQSECRFSECECQCPAAALSARSLCGDELRGLVGWKRLHSVALSLPRRSVWLGDAARCPCTCARSALRAAVRSSLCTIDNSWPPTAWLAIQLLPVIRWRSAVHWTSIGRRLRKQNGTRLQRDRAATKPTRRTNTTSVCDAPVTDGTGIERCKRAGRIQPH